MRLDVQTSCGSTRLARLSTRKNPHMSVMVVSNGPDATAGSIFMRLSSNGTVPKSVGLCGRADQSAKI